MREKMFSKVKQNSGYTLVEMLIVVALTVVLLGISVLSISHFSKVLKMTELDEYAKTIYLEAQNQMAAKEVEGGLPAFSNAVNKDYKDRYLAEMPQDYDTAINGETWKQLCYLVKSDDLVAQLLQVEAENYVGNYILELNPLTGDIYGVFYWETEAAYQGEVNAAYYKNYYQTVIGRLSDRSKDARTEKMVGYYGGNFIDTAVLDIDMDLKVEVINAEELYLKVTLEGGKAIKAYAEGLLDLTYEIKDEEENIYTGSFKNSTFKNNASLKNSSVEITNKITAYLLLDSMEAGCDYNNITGLTIGDNLAIKVIATYQQGGYEDSESVTTDTNSLFGEKQNAGGKENANAVTTITMNYLRHLQNINDYSGTSVVPWGEIRLNQNQDIDFATKAFAWEKTDAGVVYKGENTAARPSTLNSWKPLANAFIFNKNSDDNQKQCVFDGNGYKLKNFTITGSGLIASSTFTDFTDVILENVKVSGGSNTGALAGSFSHGIATNCGVYLATYTDESGTKQYYSQNTNVNGYDNEMDMRYATMTVNGSENVGGLFGSTSGTELRNCYAAVKVNGTSQIGGLVGSASNTVIRNSYSSGDVRGTGNNVGGFLGRANIVEVTNAYTTGNVYSDGYAGGFLGAASRSSFEDCTAYGEVLNLNEHPALAMGGGFIAPAANDNNVFMTDSTGGTKVYTCKYLNQAGYNSEFTNSPEITNIKNESYQVLKDTATAASGASFPYEVVLEVESFPFTMISTLNHHHGNWPLQFQIDNALVYYEKYADGWYGYYSVTRMTNAIDENTNYVWLLNTLRDEECIEDGYAFLSRYNLTQFGYDLYVGSGTEKMPNVPAQLTVVSDENLGDYNTSVLLRQQGALTFSAYDITMADEEYHFYDYSTQPAKDYMVVSGMYLYRLPYELQNTDRTKVSNFYDRLVIKNAYAVGSDTPVIGDGQSGEQPITFYYCPHFAKAAINPGFTNNTFMNNPNVVYVRSARQLNALGRYPYYWNDENGTMGFIDFQQETDVNFGTYGTKVNTGEEILTYYCGEIFEMNISPEELTALRAKYSADIPDVRNHTIGVANVGEFSDKQFRNDYNGQTNRIIDYCLYSDEQFSGLFGEILNSRLDNIVMTVSEEGKGIIQSTYYDGVPNEEKRAGLGALVGLAYMDKNIISNCAAAGYEVTYVLNDVPAELSATHELPTGIAVGGLIGFSLSDINNCTANNDVSFVANRNYDRAVFLGGFIGSFRYGNITYAYSGGTVTLDADNNDDGVGDYSLTTLAIGGFSPGWLYTSYEDSRRIENKETVYKHIYTYTDVKDSIWVTKEGTDTYFAPAVSRLDWDGSVGLEENNLSSPEHYICMYIEAMMERHMARLPEEKTWYYDARYYSELIGWLRYGQMASAENYEYLSKTVYTITDFHSPIYKAQKSYPYVERLQSFKYPFPAVNWSYDDAGNMMYVHYGDWILSDDTVDPIHLNYPAYYEKYEDGSTGIYYLDVYNNPNSITVDLDGNVIASALSEEKTIMETGYGELTLKSDTSGTVVAKALLNGQIYQMYYQRDFLNNFVENFADFFGIDYVSLEMEYDFERIWSATDSYDKAEVISKDLYVNTNFAAAISPSDNLGNEENPLQVRTQQQLMEVPVNWSLAKDAVYIQTRDIVLDSSFTSIELTSGETYYGGIFYGDTAIGYRILGATRPVFSTNNGTLYGVQVIDADINTVSNGAALVVTNNGTIDNCMVTGKIEGYNNAAALAVTNNGTISNSVANAEVSATTNAAGFVLDSATDANIINCNFSGTVDRAANIYEFVRTGVVTNCTYNGVLVEKIEVTTEPEPLSEEPETTEEPAVPEEPETTEEAVIPKEPETTEAPAVPEEPVVPEESETTEEAVIPEELETTEEAVIPEEPETTEEAVIPEEPETTEEAVMPEEPETMEEPVIPEELVVPEEPVVPKEPPVEEEPQI